MLRLVHRWILLAVVVVIKIGVSNSGYRVPSVMLDALVGLYGSVIFMIWTPWSIAAATSA